MATNNPIDDTINTVGKDLVDFYSTESQILGRKSQWYDKIASSVTKCPFCDLKDKYIIAEKGKMVLTVNLFPYVEGHLMVIPRTHIEKLADFSVEDWQSSKDLIALGIDLIKKGLKVQDVNVLYREGTKKSGSSLKHLHIHLLPITKDFMVYEDFGFTYKFQDIKVAPVDMAEKLRGICQKIHKKE
jgi:diadenosine tetraphosphate (Ap4A) HIT family hydrolase